MKDRRRRLNQLALSKVSPSDIDALRLHDTETLDAHAPRVVKLLQQRNIEIPPPLIITVDGHQDKFESIYRALNSCCDADKFFNMGFRDVDPVDHCTLPPLAGHRVGYWESLEYLHWLVQHGANLFRLLKQTTTYESTLLLGKGEYTAHHTFSKVGVLLRVEMIYGPNPSSHHPTHALNRLVLPCSLADYCRCMCSPGGCTPFTNMLQAMLNTTHNDELEKQNMPFMIKIFSPYLINFWADLGLQHHVAAIRYLTFSALGITHTCCNDEYDVRSSRLTGEDVDEIHEEEGPMINLLEELLEEFVPKVTALLRCESCGPDKFIEFLKDYWPHRMRDVLDDFGNNRSYEEEIQAAEEIGVVWDDLSSDLFSDSTQDQNPYTLDTLEHWMYKLDQIASEPPADSFFPSRK